MEGQAEVPRLSEEEQEDLLISLFARGVQALERISGSLDVLAQAQIVQSGGDVSRGISASVSGPPTPPRHPDDRPVG